MNSGEKKVGSVRKIAAIVVSAAFVVGLAACSDLPAQVQDCTPLATPGAASEAVTASGTFGENPKVHMPSTLSTKHAETSILKKGKGMTVGEGDIGIGQVTVYLASTGKVVQSTAANGVYSKSSQTEMPIGKAKYKFSEYLSCQTVGTRSATVMTASEYLGGAAKAKASNVSPSAALVVVVDIEQGFRGRAVGTLQAPQAGFPSVVTSGNGTPGLTIDLQEPPKTLQWEVVRKGSGQKLKTGDIALMQVEGVEWTNPAPTTTFDSTWTTGIPRPYSLVALQSADGTYSLDPGSAKALKGQTVGSQVLVVVPPKYGYPSGKAPSGYPTGSTLIFVYDIVGVLK